MSKEALEQSIQIWEERRDIIKNNLGKPLNRYLPNKQTVIIYYDRMHCPLCAMLNNSCDNCPVYKHSKATLSGCLGTPYSLVEKMTLELTEKHVQQHEKEIEFLKSLRSYYE